ncbi:MAG: HAMP domain-containing sensor histidine kinase [Aggregatilineales bacterium]
MSELPPEHISIEQARRAFEEEISILAHDLAGPLARIINCLQLSKDLLAAQELSAIPQLLDIALVSVQGQLRNIELLQDITRMLNGLKKPPLGKAELVPALEAALAELQELIIEAEANCSTSIPADLPATCADQEVLTRICFNLLENALRHVPKGGTIRVTASYEVDTVRVCVADNGKGVAEEHRERIFEKFYRVSSSQVRGRRGMGLGLTFAKLAVEGYGGALWLESPAQGGAVFCFRLPASHEVQT